MKLTKSQTAEREEYMTKLREIVKPGDTVYTTLRHVSRSGMSRLIGVWAMPCEKGQVSRRFLSYWAAKIIDAPFDDKTETVRMGGCGMDMGFALVYNLSRCLYRGGFGLPMYLPTEDRWKAKGKRPRSKREAERLYAKGYRSFGRNGDDSGWDNDGGYALKQEWL